MRSETFYEPDNSELELLGVKDIEKGKELSTGIFAWSTFDFFRQEALSELDVVSRIDDLVTYRKRNSPTIELITIDEKSGLVIKREFPQLMDSMEQGSFRTYKHELRNLSYDVDDSAFKIPEEFRMITAAEARATPVR